MNTTKTQFPQRETIPAPLEIHPSVSPLAAELLLKVAEVLAARPKLYNQQIPYPAECGAPCCIIGHMEMEARAMGLREIGLTGEQSNAIFLFNKWPEQFRNPVHERYWKGKCRGCLTSTVTAPEGIARIEHFLRTGE